MGFQSKAEDDYEKGKYKKRKLILCSEAYFALLIQIML